MRSEVHCFLEPLLDVFFENRRELILILGLRSKMVALNAIYAQKRRAIDADLLRRCSHEKEFYSLGKGLRRPQQQKTSVAPHYNLHKGD